MLPLAPQKVIARLDHYLALEGKPVMRAMAEQRMLEKLTRSLTEEVAPMLPASVRWSDADAIPAFERVWTEPVARISGTHGSSPLGSSRSCVQRDIRRC